MKDDILKNIQIMLRSKQSQDNPIGHVTSPIVVGGSIIALKCKEGVIIATDTLLSYGGLLKYPDVCRHEQITQNIVMTATGEYADFQQATRRLNELSRQSYIFNDNVQFSVKDYANFLAKICYEKRNNQNPYYNNFVLAGFEGEKSYLASVDMYGNFIAKDFVVAGFAKHFGLALIANEWNPNKTAAECKEILNRCFMIIYERVCSSVDRVQFALIEKDSSRIEAPTHIESRWDFRDFRERKNQRLWQ